MFLKPSACTTSDFVVAERTPSYCVILTQYDFLNYIVSIHILGYHVLLQ